MSTKVKLLRPLDGKVVGAIVEYPDADAKRLEARGAVQIVSVKAAPKPRNKKAPKPRNKKAPDPANKAGETANGTEGS